MREGRESRRSKRERRQESSKVGLGERKERDFPEKEKGKWRGCKGEGEWTEGELEGSRERQENGRGGEKREKRMTGKEFLKVFSKGIGSGLCSRVKDGLKNGERRRGTQGGIYCSNIDERCWGDRV